MPTHTDKDGIDVVFDIVTAIRFFPNTKLRKFDS